MLSKSQIKYIQSLGHKKQRDEDGCFIAEGPKVVAEISNAAPGKIRQVFALKEWIDSNKSNIPATEITDFELAKISQQQTPNGVLAIVDRFDIPETIDTHDTIVLAMDGIQDPGNLGTIIRIADWFGVRNIVCSPETADAYNPKVVQSTMGSIARIGVMYTDLATWIGNQENAIVYGAMLDGQDIRTMNKLQQGIVVIGNESKGISAAVISLITKAVTIPRLGGAESLNAAVATGIILSHLA